MGEHRPRRRADPDAAKDTRPRGVAELPPEVIRAGVNPEPADVVRRSGALGGNAAALRTARALGFAGGDLDADAYTGEEPPDFFFGVLADLDVPVPDAPPRDSPASTRAAAGPPVPGIPAPSRTGGPSEGADHAAEQPAEPISSAAVTEATEGTAAAPGSDATPKPATPRGAVVKVPGTPADGVQGGASTSSAAPPATAVGPTTVESPDELVTAVSTAAGKLGTATGSSGPPPDVAAGRAFPSALAAPATASAPSAVRGGGSGVRRPKPDDDLPPDPVPKATKAVTTAAAALLPELALPQLLSPPGGPAPTLAYPQQFAELKRPEPPKPEKPKQKKPAAKAPHPDSKTDPKQEPPAPAPAPQPFVPPVLLDLRQPPMPKVDPTLRSAEQTKIRTVIASVKADLPTAARPFVRQLRDAAGFGDLLTQQYGRKEVAAFWEPVIGDKPLAERLLTPMRAKLDELGEAAGLSASILDQAVKEKQQELIASGRAVSDQTKALVAARGPVIIGEAEKRAAEETAKVAKEHAQRLKDLRRAMTSHDPKLVTQLADERVTMIGDQVAGGILALENAATRRTDLIEAMTAAYLEAYRIADDAAQASARAAAAKAADPVPSPSVVQVPRAPDGRPWLTWAREQVVASMKALRTQTTTDRDARIGALREAGVTATAAVREWADKRLRHKATQQEKEAQAVADRTVAEQRLEKARTQAAKDRARDDLVAQIRYAEAFHDARQAEAAGTATEAQKKMLAEAGKDADAYLGAADVPGDPLSAVAHHLTEQVGTQVVAKLTESGVISAEVKKLRATTSAEAFSLGVVVFATKPPDAASRVASLSAATREKYGTDEDAVFAALDNLDGQQIDTISTLYQADYDEGLYDRLDGELSGSEWSRAKALLRSDQVGATAAAIRYETNSWFSAPDRDKIASYVRSLPPGKGDELKQRFGESARWYNSGSATLDEVLGDTMRTYRYNPQTGESVPDDRGSEQIGLLLQVNMLKQPEPAAPAGLAGAAKPRPSIIDAQDRQNKIDALQAKADAIDLDLALRPAYGPAKADAMDGVFKRMRAEIADANPGWTAEQVNNEVRRRNANTERAYGERFPAELQVNNFGMPVQNLRPEDSRLRQVMAANLYDSGEKEIGLAMLDVDRKAERTARILLADRGAYAADSDVNAGLEQSYLQAADEIKRAEGPRLRKERADRIRKAQQEGHPLTQDQLAEEDRKLDRELERLTDKRAKELMAETKIHWNKSGHGSLDDWVKDKTQWGGEREAVWRLEQGGKLTRAQELKFSVDGWGMDIAQAKKALAGRTPAEIRQIAADYKKITGEDLIGRLHSETSGENRFDIDEALRGEPMTAQERMDALTRRYEYNKNTYFWGGGPPKELAGSMRMLQAEYDNAREAFAALNDPAAKLSVEDRNFLQRSFEAQATRTESRAEEYRASVHAYTDGIVQIVSTAVAVIVGGALAIATGGAALPLIALAASLWATAATMVVKMALLGEAYGIHEYVDDLVVGVVDAAFAYATAGLGDKLLGVSKVTGADKAAIRLAAAAARAQRAAKPLIARMGATLVENVAGAAPSALAGNLVNRDNWRGDMFLNVTKGTFTQMGTGMAIGGVIGQSLEISGRILGAVAGPALERFRAGRTSNAATEAAAHAAGTAEHQHVPGTERAPKPAADATGAPVARVETAPDAIHQQQREMRREVLGDIPPRERGAYADTPILVLGDAEYAERTGSAERGMATVLIENGKPLVVIREGAPLWALREEGRHLQQLRDPIHAEHLRLLDEARLRDWKNLSLHERMLSAQAHLELELAAQHDIIADLTHQKLAGSEDPHLQARLDTALRAQEVLGHRLEELHSFRNSPDGSPPPKFLEEPSRLNTKTGDPAPSGPAPPAESSHAEAKLAADAEAKAAEAKAAAEARAAADQAVKDAEEQQQRWRERLVEEKDSLATVDKSLADLTTKQAELDDLARRIAAEKDAKTLTPLLRRRREILADVQKTHFDPDVELPLSSLESAMKRERTALNKRRTELAELVANLEHRLSGDKLDPKLPVAGAYDDIKNAQGGDRHHMPANDSLERARALGTLPVGNPLLTHGGGGVIRMDDADHSLTASHGSGYGPEAYRDKQVALIAGGRYLEAVKMDLDDIRGNPVLRDKYEKVIQKYLNFLEQNQHLVDQLNKNSSVTIDSLRNPKE
ncbi:Annexin [Actinopolymorpha cephalotaxi]|uniref:Annexin n=1 Tax=Actinopolymorpha cephalotaxi TaxID=504797 RepID=A0A1I2PD30_9ACTN|nr:hypothetical protein [Actinopolymorpha cephalotaxi]NYH83744.1 hypothetical protein [Actinopolymorpha cephalotaxi]SFG11371.1 Annexin [Actinopolymorpha cephalotaxi]